MPNQHTRPEAQAREDEFHRALQERLVSLRNARGWTQEQLAQELELSRLTIVHMEQGRRPPNPYRLVQIANLYGVSVGSLLGQQEDASDREAWAVLLAQMGNDRPNLFRGREEIGELAQELAGNFAQSAWEMVRAVARERVAQ